MANDVLGAAIVAYAVSNDLLNELFMVESGEVQETVFESHTTARDTLHRVSRQPFLWRHMRKHLSKPEALVEGWYLGYLLSSYWNDPVVAEYPITISSTEDEYLLSLVFPTSGGDTIECNIVAPARLYGVVRNCRISADMLIVEGENNASFFLFSGANDIVCETIQFRCRSIGINGSLTIRGANVDTRLDIQGIEVDNDSRIALSEAFRRYPMWNNIAEDWVEMPNTAETQLVGAIGFIEFLQRWSNRSLILTDSFDWPGDDRDQGARRSFYSYSNSRELLRLLVEHELATTAPQASGGRERKVRINFLDVDWDSLKRAFLGETVQDDRIRIFAESAIEKLGQ